jgi:hypothetical protein
MAHFEVQGQVCVSSTFPLVLKLAGTESDLPLPPEYGRAWLIGTSCHLIAIIG